MIRVRIPRPMSEAAIEAYFLKVTGGSPVPVVVIHQTLPGVRAAAPELIGDLISMVTGFVGLSP